MHKYLLTVIPLAFLFSLVGYFFRKFYARRELFSAEKKAREILEEAKREAENIKKEAQLAAREELYRIRSDFEREVRNKRNELERRESKLSKREENLERRVELLELREKEIKEKSKALTISQEELNEKKKKFDEIIEEEKRKLVQISGLSIEEARKIILSQVEKETHQEAALLAKKIEDEAKEKAERKAKEILSLAIQRCSTDHVTESTVSVIPLPSEEMKGRIIGREGRNIRTFEMLTGVNVIIDDTPEAVSISSFDPIRREIAKIAMERLVEDGRIHPARIEEVVEKVKNEFPEIVKEEGEKAAFETGVHDLHPQEIDLLGKLKYRTSFGQNVLQHSKEVAIIMGVMASELGLDPQVAKRIGLIHDIGKAVSQEVEGSHDKIGAEISLKLGESDEVVQAIKSHHEVESPQTLYGVLLQAADALSAARPGARRETIENYVRRLERLENIAYSFDGVEKAYAIQAGREIRVIVEPSRIDDGGIVALARDITQKVKKEIEFAGEIRVTIIRETRAIEYAK